MRTAIGIDVGGTKIAAARVDEDGRVLARFGCPSPATDEAGLADAMAEAARAVLAPDVVAVGVGAAGLVQDGVLRAAPNLAWEEFPIAATMTSALGLPCVADNDANTAAWGEFRAGAGAAARHLLMLTIGTGIGGGIVSEGRLMRGAHGLAGEVGHIIVEPDGPECGCGNRGCWEQVASGRAIDRLAREAVATDPTLSLAWRAGERSIDGAIVTEAAADGDPTAREILATVGRRLGEGIAGLVNVLDPDVVVIGGGGAAAGDALLEPARRAFTATVEAADKRPEVPLLEARLGNDAGMVGAALLALEAQA